jgi:hypothetical protein
MRTTRDTAAVLAAALLIAAHAHAVEIRVGDATGAPGSTPTFSVSLNAPGQDVAGTENEIAFEDDAEIPELVLSTTLAVAIDADDTTIQVANATGFPSFGTLVIGEETVTYGRVDRVTNTFSQVKRGELGTTAAPHDAGAGVDTATGVPQCTGSPTLNKDVVFSFVPADPPCTPGEDCTGIKAIVVRICEPGTEDCRCEEGGPCTSLDPIPDGATLYTCTVAIDDEVVPPTTFPLDCSEARASDPDGNLLDDPDGDGEADTTCDDGIVDVREPSTCCGDQDGNETVSAAEASRAVLAFGRRDPSINPAADCDSSGSVSAAEASRVVLNFGRRQCNP